MINQNGVVIIADARLDEIYCWAQTTNATPPTKITSPHTTCRPTSRSGGGDSRRITQKINRAIPATSSRNADKRNGGKDFNATCTPKNVEPQMM
jgi:hypothetical protein